jgi:hypothetical protein
MFRVASVLIVFLMGRASPAAADNAVEAEQLFRDGRALLKAGKLAAACEAFEGSQRLEPGIATLLNLADCRERNQQLATAWSVYLQAASKARSDASASRLAGVARDRAAALEPRLSFLTIHVSDNSRVDGLEILRNGVALDPAVWNRAIPVDGGHYLITGKAPGLEPWSHTVELQAERDHQSVNVPRFQVAAIAVAHAVAEPAATPPASPEAGGRNLLALGVGVGALAALGVAAGFELSGRASYDRYQHAPKSSPTLYDAANTKHHIAQGLALVGIGCAAVAVYFWRSAPPGRPDRIAWVPVVGRSVAGVAFAGGF